MPSNYVGVGRPPDRRLSAVLLGAGASKAAGLPLTEELLERVWPRHGASSWHSIHSPGDWAKQLRSAVTVLYPDGNAKGFRPSVADFFTMLEVVAAVHEGRERLPIRAAELLQDLRTEVALGLLEATRSSLDDTPHRDWLLSERRPQVVVTSNWDTMVEEAALQAGLRVLLRWPLDKNGRRKNTLRRDEMVVLKLHGSVDLGFYRDATDVMSPLNLRYASLETPVAEATPFGRATKPSLLPLRYRTLDAALPNQLGFEPPLMATMAVGKQVSIDALDEIWGDAYWVISRARDLSIVGYSFPADDLELRTLLRTTTRQAGMASLAKSLRLQIVNPSPDAHERARSFLGAAVGSDYRSGSDWFR